MSSFLGHVVNFAKDWGTLIVTVLPLPLTIISLISGLKSQRLQNSSNTLDIKIKEDKIAKERAESLLSCIKVKPIRTSNNRYALKVYNYGSASAYNVSTQFDGEAGMMIINQEIQPFDELATNEDYLLNLCVPDGAASKFNTVTKWTDTNGQSHTQTQTLTLP